MSTYTEHCFSTKAGTCIITPERIVLERHGFQRVISSLLYGDTINRAAILYGLITSIAFGLGAWAFAQGSYLTGVLLYLIGLPFFRNLIMCRNTSVATVIERSSIQTIEVHKPHPPFTRGYFTVWFSENGKKQRRFIMLPSFMANGSKEYPKAVMAMQETGLLRKAE
jgi:hypothetical protein